MSWAPSRRSVLLASLAALALPRRADANPADGLLERLAAARRGLRSLHGPFRQTRTVGLLATDVRSTGVMTLVLPDRIRWELAPPDDVTFWVGPEGAAYRSRSGGGRLPAGRGPGALEDLRAALGGDQASLLSRWNLRVVRDDPSGAELEGKAVGGGPIGELRLVFGADLVRLVRVTLVEGPRDRTVIEFGPLVVNGLVVPEDMRPPP